jgi:hypothetical protein
MTDQDARLLTELREYQRTNRPSSIAPGPLSDRALNTLVGGEFDTDIATARSTAKSIWDLPAGTSDERLQELIGAPNGWDSTKTLRFVTLIRAIHEDLEQRYHEFLLQSYYVVAERSKAKSPDGKPYWANRFNPKVKRDGGLPATRWYLAQRDPQPGLNRMIRLGLPELSLDYVVLEYPWRTLFTPQELAKPVDALRPKESCASWRSNTTGATMRCCDFCALAGCACRRSRR